LTKRSQREKPMPIRNRYPSIPGSRFFAFAVALVWLICAGSARAGDGGGELVGPLRKVLDDTCSMLNITSCPSQKLTTVNQLVVEIAALTNTTPSDVRNSALPGEIIPPGGAVDGGTHNGVVTPIAFISPPNKTGPPVPTPPTNPAANSFISAAFSNGTVNFTFNYLPRTISPFNLGQVVGDIGLPVAVIDMNGNLQREVSADLQIFGEGGPCPGTTCVRTQVVADLEGTGPQTFTKIKDQLDIDFSLDFSGMGGSEVIKLGVPLIEIDNLLGFAAPGFEFDTINRLFYGIDPAPTDHLTASFLNDANDPPAVFANLAVSRDGDTVLSSPGLPEPSTLALLASGVVGLGLVLSLRRRSTPDRSAVA
jgi:hypothetical protein